MEDGGKNLEISGAGAEPEKKEISREKAVVCHDDFNSKMTLNSGQSFGDSNGSPEMESDSDGDGISRRFHIPTVKSKVIADLNVVNTTTMDVETVQTEDVVEDDRDDDNTHSEEDCLLGFGEVYDDKRVPASPEDPTIPTELTADSTNSLMCLSDIASTLRPNSLPRVDGLDAEEMEVDLSESDEEVESCGASSKPVLQCASALDPAILSESRTEVTSVQELCGVDNSESLSESRLLKGEENEADTQVIDNDDRTEYDDDYKAGSVESLGQNELSVDRPCPNGESISSDSMLGSNQPVSNLSRCSDSPVNSLSDIEKESLTNLTSRGICDSEQVYVDKDEAKVEDNSTSVSESEMQNLSSEPDKVEALCENLSQDNGSPSGICDKATLPQVETEGTEGLLDSKSMFCSTEKNQCNGDIDSHDDSNQDGEGWCDTFNISGQIEDNPEEGSCNENLEGKRKQTFDDEEGVNCLSGNTENPGPTKMFKVNHSVTQSNQQSSVEKGCSVRAPCVSQPLDGRSFFPGNIQANSQITEYAQYLGLQPTVKFKCVRCGEKSFSTMMDLKTHQYACLKSHVTSQPNPSPASLPSHQTSSTNFRITRKVYLCSVCGTYYENWNLFLHMREVHKRHICLFCLGMFSQAERLSAHLIAKHNIVEGHYGNVEEFRLSCKGSVFLMCCSCEKVFSEEDSFSNHPCKDRSLASKSKPSSNTLVSGKSQTSHVFSKSSSTEKSKLSVEGGGSSRPTKQSESKSGKGSAASGRPKQILKVKIPMQPKVQTSIPLTKTPKPPPVIQEPSTATICQKNGLDTTQLADAHLDSVPKSKELPAALAQPANDGDFMSNLDRTINSVALGLSSEALEWQQRKNETFEDIQGLEELSTLPCLDGAVKSDSDSDHHSVSNLEGDENMDSKPSDEHPAEQIPEIQAEVPETLAEETEKQSSPMHIPEIEPSSLILPDPPQPVVEELPSVQQEAEVLPRASPPPLELAMDIAPSPAAPESPSEPVVTEQTPAEEDSDIDTDDSDKLSLVVDETAGGAENEEKTAPAEIPEPLESVPSEPTNLPEGVEELKEGVESLPHEGLPHEGLPHEDLPHEDLPLNEDPALTNEANSEKGPDIALAGEDVPVTEVMIEESLEDIPIQALLKECVKALCYVCVYCSHARRIAVNGKQLALHTLAEHRFSPVDGSDKQDPPPCARFTSRLKSSVQILQNMYFNTDTYDSTDKTSCLPYDRTYECFHCHFFTRSHKELYIHNRKMHQKTILLCIMCKSNFYSYSELLCHLCPGIYIPQCNISFHCCMCDVDNLPSAFRLMVHLRKRHHACDVCLEITDDQQKLSSHVWKHKLHHLCYRCGIAYRNKPDITNHLFWKHGTESVLCKKCLQKKWPHVYHFCVPPATFTCEECNSLFTRAVSLRVHKRIHTGEQPHPCLECEEKFISKKLLAKHSLIHRTPVPEEKPLQDEALTAKGDEDKSTEDLRDITSSTDDQKEDSKENVSDVDTKETDKRHSSKKKKHKEKEEQKKKVVDVYDLPPLNLSSESDSSDDEAKKDQPVAQPTIAPTFTEVIAPAPQPIEESQPAQVVDGIWDNFQNYKANLEKMENAEAAAKNPTPEPQEDPNALLFKIVMMDHDYCAPVDPNKPPEPEPVVEVKEKIEDPITDTEPVDKLGPENIMVEETPSLTPPHSKDDIKSTISESPSKKKRSPKKKARRRSSSSSSNSSSGSDSSSCSCGTNCSCSSTSSSDSSSSSSDSDSSSSEGRRRALVRRELRKERALEKKKEEEAAAAAATAAPMEEPHIDVMEAEPAFRESDLDTTETDTDEDFYDERPQKLLEESQAEKRNLMLLASVAPLNNGSGSPTAVQQDAVFSNTQFAVPELNAAAVTGGKKRTKKRKKKQSSHFHSKLSHHPEIPPPSLSSVDSQSDVPSERFPPTYYPYSAPSPIAPVVQRHTVAPSFQQSTPELNSKRPLVTKLTREVVPHPGSGSETEGRTKRKRMPNKFYGYSSDEEAEESSTHKWRKTETTVAHPPPPPVVATIPRQPVSPLTLKRTVPSVQEAPPPITLNLSKRSLIAKADSDSEESKRVTSSSSSSDSDDNAMQISEGPPTGHASTTLAGDAPVRETNDNLYCYCQCPYDEVSEMIACDGKNCAIEWFHFECVGIMVPPKGQWYCPDCRKNMTGYQGVE